MMEELRHVKPVTCFKRPNSGQDEDEDDDDYNTLLSRCVPASVEVIYVNTVFKHLLFRSYLHMRQFSYPHRARLLPNSPVYYPNIKGTFNCFLTKCGRY
jgi:hypothetical protein